MTLLTNYGQRQNPKGEEKSKKNEYVITWSKLTFIYNDSLCFYYKKL